MRDDYEAADLRWVREHPWTLGLILAAIIAVIVLITWYLARPGFPAEPPVNSFCDNAWHAVIYTSQSGDIAVGPKC
jgi:hypothetical protein